MASIQDIYNMQAGLYETPDFSDINYTSQYSNTNDSQAVTNKRNKLKRAAELKANKLNRTVEVKYDSNNELINDSDTMIRAKQVTNAGLGAADWLLEASENIADFGQGDLLNKRMTANRDGKVYGMNNKDFIAAGKTNVAEMKDYLDKQEYDPYSNEVFYNFRKWDGYEEDGKTDKYIYKTGYSSAGGADRYKSQMMQDKYELLEEKRFDGAANFEKTWNALPEVLAERTLDLQAGAKNAEGKWQNADKASKVDFGTGWTELSNKNLLGSNENQTPEELAINLAKSKQYSSMNAEFRDQGFGDSLLRAPQAFLAGGGKSAYGTADTLVELGGDLVGRGVGLIDPETGKLIDKAVDLGTADEITERSNALVGYDNRYTSAIMASVTDKYGKAMKNVELFSPASWLDMDVGSLVDAVKVAFTSPESAAYSLGYMAPALVGAFSKAGTKLFGTALKTYGDDVAKIAADITTDVAAKELAQKALYKGLSKSDKTKLFLNNHVADAAGMGALMTNEQLDKYIKDNGGEDATIAKTLGAWMINTAGMKLDTMSAKGAIGITKEIKQSLAEQIGAMGKANASKFVAKATEYLLKATMAGAKEAPQEWLQTLGEVFNEVYGTKKIDIDGKETGETVGLVEALGEKTRDKAGVGMVMGTAGGAHMSMGGSAVDAAKLSFGKVSKVADEESDRIDSENEAYERGEEAPISTKTYENLNTDIDELLTRIESNEEIDPFIELNTLEDILKSFEERETRDEHQEALKDVNYAADANSKFDKFMDETHKERKDKAMETIDSILNAAFNEDGTPLSEQQVRMQKYLNDGIANLSPEMQVEFLGEQIAYNQSKAKNKPEGLDLDDDMEPVVKKTYTKKGTKEKIEEEIEKDKATLEQELTAETSQDENYTEGISKRSIEKLAKQFGLDKFNTQAILNSALGAIQIRKMGNVGKKANSRQHADYYGKDGLIPTLTEYRAKIEDKDSDGAFKTISRLQNKTFTTEKDLNRYITKYEDLRKTITGIINAAPKLAAIKKVSEAEYIATTLKNFKDEYRAQHSKYKMSAIDVAKDMDNVTQETKDLLGIKEGETSNVSEIMLAKMEFVDHADQALASFGHVRKISEGIDVSADEDAIKYANTLTELSRDKQVIEDLLADEDITEDVKRAYQNELLEINKRIKNNEDGIDSKANITGYGSRQRFVETDSNAEEMSELNAELISLQSKKITPAIQGRIDEIDTELRKFKTAENTNEQIKSNLGKKVQNQSENIREVSHKGYSKRPTAIWLRERRKQKVVDPKVQASVDANVQGVEETFTASSPKATKEGLEALVNELKSLKVEKDEATVSIAEDNAAAKAEYDTAQSDLEKELGENAKVYIKAQDTVANANAEVAKHEAALKKLKTKRTNIEKGLLNSIHEQLTDINKDSAEHEAEILTQLETIAKGMNDNDISSSRSVIGKLSKKLFAAAEGLVAKLGSMRSVLFRYLQGKAASELGKQIHTLEKQIAKAKVTKQTALDSIGEIVIGESANNLESINAKGKELKAKYKQIKTLEAKLDGSKKLGIKQIATINKLITEVKKNLFGTQEFTDWLRTNSPATTKDGVSRKLPDNAQKSDKEHQLLNIADSVEFTDTLLGKVPVELMSTLMDEETGKMFDLEFEQAQSAVDKILKFKFDKSDGKETNTMSPMQLKDSPISGLLFGKTSDTPKNKQLVLGFMLVGMNWLGANGVGNLHNNDEDIARMLGYPSEAMVTAGDRTLLAKMGSFRKVTAFSLGKQLASTIGMKMKPDTSVNMESKIYGDMGMMVLAYMEGRGAIETMAFDKSNIPMDKWNKLSSKQSESKFEKSEATIPMVISKPGDEYKALYESMGKNIRLIEEALDIDTLDKNYVLTAPKSSKDGRQVRGSIGIVSDTHNKTMDKIEATEWGLSSRSDGKSIVDLLINTSDSVYVDRQDYLDHHGWVDIEKFKKELDGDRTKARLFDDLEAQISTNREIEHSIDELIELDRKTKEGLVNKGFFFNWFFSQNGRFMLDSIGINPQSDKNLHRWLIISAKANNKEWSTTGKDFAYFKQGVAQAFGVGIDKKNPAYVKETAEALMKLSYDELKAGLRNRKIEVNGKELEIEHTGHAVQAIQAIAEYQKAMGNATDKTNFTFKAPMISEYDSVTSGFAHKLLQVPLLGKKLAKWLGKTGIFKSTDTEGLDTIGMSEYIANGTNEDAYRTLARDVFKEGKLENVYEADYKDGVKTGTESENKDKTALLGMLVSEWDSKLEGVTERGAVEKMVDEDGVVTGWARNLFKYPFMIFNYAASIASIRKNLSEDMAKDVIEGILQGRYQPDGEFLRTLGVVGKNANEIHDKLIEDLQTISIDSVRIGNRKVPLLKELSALFDGTYGRQVEKTMTTEFEALTKANNVMIGATKMMFKGFITSLTEKTLEAEAAKGNKGLSQAEVDDIVKGLAVQYPMLKSPNGTSEWDGIGIIDTGLVSKEDYPLQPGKIHIKGKVQTLSVQTMIREYQEAQNSGAVLPIHWIDGTVIGEILKRGGILGIHDAVAIGDDFEDSIMEMNKATFDTGLNYNLTGEMYKALMDSVQATVKAGHIDKLTPVEAGDQSFTLLELISEMEKVAKDSQTARDDLFADGLVVGNIADMAGSVYKSSAVIQLATVEELNDIMPENLMSKNITLEMFNKALIAASKEC